MLALQPIYENGTLVLCAELPAALLRKGQGSALYSLPEPDTRRLLLVVGRRPEWLAANRPPDTIPLALQPEQARALVRKQRCRLNVPGLPAPLVLAAG